ncbi:pesticin C-terminus-like muramidase [Bradyrhizobium sp. JYMT SZCCT0428]|uniref:pesticin C-terminus-like muramidase n=1 Tax=Bradyrhizobium sp. JYMT SZCCT0428 TaxID=2807673 RepID=UPI001BA7E1BD|nr:pesticin C-terminus-like muramidase [Bradyrhizobium sp. JYMT SZCCT0428]MBR1156268.1 hypothetical protein [Bradyrhizobium sp. JYMT SZCCT0428]
MAYPNAFPTLTAKPIVLTAGSTYSFSELFTYTSAVGNTGDPIAYVGAYTTGSGNYTITGYHTYDGYYAYTIEGNNTTFRPEWGSFWSGSITVSSGAVGSISLGFSYSLGFFNSDYNNSPWLYAAGGGGGSWSISAPFFTTSADTVNFNNLAATQIAAATTNSNSIYNALDGNDNVALPNSTTIPGVTGVSWNFNTPFNAGAGNDTVTGGLGNDNINGGLGNDIIYAGGGNNTIDGGGGTDTIILDGNGHDSIVFSASNQVVKLQRGTAGPIVATINGFVAGDEIDFSNRANLTLSAAYGIPGEVDVYSGKTLVATLTFNGSVDVDALQPVSDGNGGTRIIVDTTNVPLNDPQPAGYSINWSFVHSHEGGNLLTPYVPLSSPGVVAGRSGITLGIGVDLSSGIISQSDFASLFPDYASNPNLKFLYGATNASTSKSAALAYLETGEVEKKSRIETSMSVSVTQSQANKLTAFAESETLADLITAWQGSSLWGGTAVVPISALPAQAQTVLVDVAFQYGPTNLRTKTPSFWRDMIEAAKTISAAAPNGSASAWTTVYSELTHFGDDYASRRLDEAALILQIPGITITVPLPAIIEPNLVASNVSSFSFAIADATTQYAFDPLGDSVYTLNAEPGSPDFSSIELPASSAAQYSVMYQIASTWSAPQIAQPLQTINLPAGVRALRVTLLDANGFTETDPESFTFYTTFASAGTFSGAVTSQVAVSPTATFGQLRLGSAGAITLSGGASALSGIASVVAQNNNIDLGVATFGADTWSFQGSVSGGLDGIAVKVTDGGSSTTTVGLINLQTLSFGASGVTANFTGAGIAGTNFTIDGGGFGNDLFVVTGTSINLAGRAFVNWTATDRVYLIGSASSSNSLVAGSTNTLIIGGALADVLSGGGASDNIYGGDGNDTASGGGGNDVLVAGNGNDTGDGGDGNDYIYAGGGIDVLTGGAGLDVLLGEGGNDSIYGGTGFNYLFGGDGSDILVGSGGAGPGDVNVMLGEAGADALYGGAGTNYLYGGAGIDNMFGGSGLNIFISSGETDGNLIYGGSGQNYVYGSNGGDTVTGGASVDVFLMGTGADFITGGGGVDYAWGGGGSDTFTINDTTSELMVIQDFNTGGVNDVLSFVGTSLHSFADVQAASFYAAGINTTIIIDAGGNAAWLIGKAPGDLDTTMFRFG